MYTLRLVPILRTWGLSDHTYAEDPVLNTATRRSRILSLEPHVAAQKRVRDVFFGGYAGADQPLRPLRAIRQ
jgi:hypothetical protein